MALRAWLAQTLGPDAALVRTRTESSSDWNVTALSSKISSTTRKSSGCEGTRLRAAVGMGVQVGNAVCPQPCHQYRGTIADHPLQALTARSAGRSVHCSIDFPFRMPRRSRRRTRARGGCKPIVYETIGAFRSPSRASCPLNSARRCGHERRADQAKDRLIICLFASSNGIELGSHCLCHRTDSDPHAYDAPASLSRPPQCLSRRDEPTLRDRCNGARTDLFWRIASSRRPAEPSSDRVRC